jgi:HAD superfamily hydrolase (TIGR01549 family)
LKQECVRRHPAKPGTIRTGADGALEGLAALNSGLLTHLGRTYDAILLDVGGILYYDDPIEPTYTYRTHLHVKAAGIDNELGPAEILRLSRDATVLPLYLRWGQWETANRLAWADTLSRWSQIAIPIPGAIEKMATLRPARLAIIANQPRQMLDVLARDGVADSCDVLALDSLCGSPEPSPEMFLFALNKLSVDPTRALMIGDRIDNDIVPAAQLGLRTLWIRHRPWSGVLTGLGVPTAWRRRFVSEIVGDASLLEGSSEAVGSVPDLTVPGRKRRH